MKVTGVVKHKLTKVTGTSQAGKEWEKQTLVIEVPGEYPKTVPIDFFNKVDLIADLKAGQEVTISVNLDGSEWKDKWYPKIDGWKVETGSVAEAVAKVESVEAVDDLPF